MSDRDQGSKKPPPKRRKDKPANIAPDAVKDPNEKTEGKPGQAPHGGDADPGAG